MCAKNFRFENITHLAIKQISIYLSNNQEILPEAFKKRIYCILSIYWIKFGFLHNQTTCKSINALHFVTFYSMNTLCFPSSWMTHLHKFPRSTSIECPYLNLHIKMVFLEGYLLIMHVNDKKQ